MAQRRNDTLELVYIDVGVRATNVQRDLQNLGRVAQAQARRVGTSFAREATPGLNGAASAARALKDRQKELDTEVQRLSLSVRNQRNAYVQGRITQDQYKETTAGLKNEINGLLNSTDDLSLAQRTRLNTSAATAERGLATLRGEASRLGLAQQVQIGLTNTFGQQLRTLGPAGAVAASGLGVLSSGFASLRQPVELSGESFSRFLGLASRAPQIIALATAAVGTLAVVGLARLANEAARVADDIDKASQSVGLAAEEFQELSFALSQSGLDAERVRTALGNLNTRVGEALQGNERYASTLTSLGVSLDEVRSGAVGVGDVLATVADGIAALPTSAQQAEAAATLFGRSLGNQLLPALRQGSDGLAELRQQARDLGLVISGDAIISLVDYADQVAALQQQFQTARVEIAAAFLPVLRDVLIPLVQNTLVPLLQTTAQRVGEVSRAFTDAGPAGDAFRRNIVSTIGPLVALGQTAVAVASAVLGSFQAITAGAAQLGTFLGTLSVAVETDPGGVARSLATRLGTQVFGFDPFAESSASGGRRGGADPIAEASRIAQDEAQSYYEAALRSFELAGDAFNFDLAALLDSIAAQTNAALERGAGNLFGGGAADAAGDAATAGADRVFADGSLALLRQRLQAAQTAFAEAGDDAGRRFAQAIIDEIRDAIEEIERQFRDITIPVPEVGVGFTDTRTIAVPEVGTRVRPLAELQAERAAQNAVARDAALARASLRAFTQELENLSRIEPVRGFETPLVPDSVLQRLAEDAERRFLFARAQASGRTFDQPFGATDLGPAAPGLLAIRELAEDTLRVFVEAGAPLADIVTAFEALNRVGGALDDSLAAQVRGIIAADTSLKGYTVTLEALAQAGRAAQVAQNEARAQALAEAEDELGRLRERANAVLGNTLTANQALIAELGNLGLTLDALGESEAAESVRDLADAINQLDASAAAASALRDATDEQAAAAASAVAAINQGTQAANQFASAVQSLADGDSAGGVGGLFGAAGSIAGLFGPQGAIIGAILGGIGSLIGTIFGRQGRRDDLESQRAAGAQARGAPSVQLTFQQFNSASFESLGDTRLQGFVDDIAQRTIDVLERSVLPRLTRLEERLA